ncbi:glutamine-hydrolyzing GMP synthase [Candidatus Bathyarchaeota archaeon]|nr:glutamine-hydrolyzing GMP synthase [Candidatus Bathyarchaeota archaeon]
MFNEPNFIAVLDFGAQYAHLIARRIRECQVYSELLPHKTSPDELRKLHPKGIILSGGPASVYAKDAPTCDPKIFSLGIPILGICYGMQLMAHMLGGSVSKAERGEYGRVQLIIDDHSDIFKGLPQNLNVWMSHGDRVIKLPKGFNIIAHTANSPIAAMGDKKRKLYGVQFHPEVTNTDQGKEILKGFIYAICGCEPSWTMQGFVEKTITKLKEQIGDDRVICALSGGVDSSTTATLVHRAVGNRLTCIFVDHGFMRKNESEQILKTFRDNLEMNLIYVDAKARFMKKLEGVTDPEEKRLIMGEEFVRVFEEEARKLGKVEWLAQGTLYPDVIESAGTDSPASRIKTHHNVAGLPRQMNLKLIEPLRGLYKDEVRDVARLLGLPEEIITRHPFPGPGLAVRIIGAITQEKLTICREASAILEEELKKAGIYDTVWQAFAVVGDDKAVGVKGDERQLGYIVTLRIVQSVDAMTADWFWLPRELVEKISNRITNEVPNVTWVTYTVSSKPPSTIEPC